MHRHTNINSLLFLYAFFHHDYNFSLELKYPPPPPVRFHRPFIKYKCQVALWLSQSNSVIFNKKKCLYTHQNYPDHNLELENRPLWTLKTKYEGFW